MSGAYFNGVWRMDWGLGNANKTATLIAILMVAVWALAYLRKEGFWVALAFFTGFGICLIHTVSRGGLVAVGCGLVSVLAYIPLPWRPWKACGVLAAVFIIMGSSLYLKTYSRYAQGLVHEDDSISNRVVLWEIAPRMMVDSPSGWGLGNAGSAYTQWYQPINRHQKYRTLVNSHLTWLVEFSWPLRLAYVFVWLSILALMSPIKEEPRTAIPRAIWIVFGISAFFSSVAECLWLWLLPVCAFLLMLFKRWKNTDWLKTSTWLKIVGCSFGMILALFLLGFAANTVVNRGASDEVVLKTSSPDTWVLVDPNVLGFDFGRTLREAPTTTSIGLLTSKKIPFCIRGGTLIVCGALSHSELRQLGGVISHFRSTRFVNPTFYPQEVNFPTSAHIEAVFGELSKSSSINEWKSRLGSNVLLIKGVADFIPNWTSTLLQ